MVELGDSLLERVAAAAAAAEPSKNELVVAGPLVDCCWGVVGVEQTKIAVGGVPSPPREVLRARAKSTDAAGARRPLPLQQEAVAAAGCYCCC